MSWRAHVHHGEAPYYTFPGEGATGGAGACCRGGLLFCPATLDLPLSPLHFWASRATRCLQRECCQIPGGHFGPHPARAPFLELFCGRWPCLRVSLGSGLWGPRISLKSQAAGGSLRSLDSTWRCSRPSSFFSLSFFSFYFSCPYYLSSNMMPHLGWSSCEFQYSQGHHDPAVSQHLLASGEEPSLLATPTPVGSSLKFFFFLSLRLILIFFWLRSGALGPPHDRPTFASFRGTIFDDYAYSKGVRQALRELAKGDPDKLKVSASPHPFYLEEMAQSTFCLCPSGWSPWSPRLFEA